MTSGNKSMLGIDVFYHIRNAMFAGLRESDLQFMEVDLHQDEWEHLKELSNESLLQICRSLGEKVNYVQ